MKSVPVMSILFLFFMAAAVIRGNAGPDRGSQGVLLAANKGAETLGFVDTQRGAQVATIAEGGITGHEVAASRNGRFPYVPSYGAAPTPDGRWLVIAVPRANKVAVADLKAMKVAHAIDVPAAPQETLIRLDGKMAYISYAASKKIAAINTADGRIEKLIDAGPGADGLAWARQ
jgi:DNA-binding beta-propeller fold protein YncE